jgi:serine/threonine protein kinase
MPSPTTIDEFVDLVRRSKVVDDKRLTPYLERLKAAGPLPPTPGQLAGLMVRDGLLTHFQAEQFLLGKWRRFTIGKYKVLERLGSGGMGSVYLCEHTLMRRRVALKVLPTAKAGDPAALERFFREARAVAALDHPNIVRAYDIDQEDNLHFLVMEHVDGSNLQEIIKKTGPMDPIRAAHYMCQAALGLQHAHESAGLVHRDIKPGNILVDRNGIVKILDMGLARFFHDEEDNITKKYDENVLGTADYLAPEQALNSHDVDIRADIYSLGATFYFTLTGRTPFAEGTVAQKLIWHQTRQPKPVRSIRPAVPEALVAVIDRMMAKDPGQRFQSPAKVAEALAPFTQSPIPPPPDGEMPQLSPAAMAAGEASMTARVSAAALSPPPRKSWQVPAAAVPAPPRPPPPPSPPPPRKLAAPPVVTPPAPRTAGRAPPTPVAVKAPAAATARHPVAAPPPVPRRAPAPEEEESPSWEKVAGDTQDPAARVDTAPSSRRKSTLGSRAPLSGRGTRTPDAEHSWLLVGGISVAVVAAALLLLWWALRGSGPDSSGPRSEGRPPLVVSRAGGANTFPTLTQALAQAGAGDTILVEDNLTEVEVVIPRGDLTIQAAPGKSVVWSCPRNADSGVKLIVISGVENVRLKGFTLDGGGALNFLVGLYGGCPGLTLEDLKFRGYRQEGIDVRGCWGQSSRKITFTDLHFTNQSPAVPVAFTLINESLRPTAATGTNPANEHFTFRRCDFGGGSVRVKKGSLVKDDLPDADKKLIE